MAQISIKFRKTLLLAILAVGFLALARPETTQAATPDIFLKPQIMRITNIDKQFVKINFRLKKFKNLTVTASVFIKENGSNEIRISDYIFALDDDGAGVIPVSMLDKNTRYTFKLKLSRTDSDFTQFSNAKTARTTK
jgi:hypothetical protein